MAATSTLKIVFGLNDGKRHTVSLKDPKSNLTMSAVTTFANAVINKEAILKNEAEAMTVEDAYISTTERVELSN